PTRRRASSPASGVSTGGIVQAGSRRSASRGRGRRSGKAVPTVGFVHRPVVACGVCVRRKGEKGANLKARSGVYPAGGVGGRKGAVLMTIAISPKSVDQTNLLLRAIWAELRAEFGECLWQFMPRRDGESKAIWFGWAQLHIGDTVGFGVAYERKGIAT